MLTCHQACSPVAVRVTGLAMSEASSQPDLLMVDVALQVTGCQECLKLLCKVGMTKSYFAESMPCLRSCAAGGATGRSELALQCLSEWEKDRSIIFSNATVSDCQESWTSIVVKKQMDSEPCRVIIKGLLAKGLVKMKAGGTSQHVQQEGSSFSEFGK